MESNAMTTAEMTQVDRIIDKYLGEEGVLIQLLLDIQQEFNWIPQEAANRISERLGIPLSQVYRVASFYKAMSLTPRGKHLVNVCLGTACQVRHGAKIIERIEQLLNIEAGETTPDMKFSLERVNCLGCCALGPVMVVDNDYHGNMSPAKVRKVLEGYS
jgi:NADH-quinone oxidoreductase subunit E